MPNCTAIKNDGTACMNGTLRDDTLCGTHRNAHNRHVRVAGERQAGKCAHFTRGRWCAHDALEGQRLCQAHHNRHRVAQANAERAADHRQRVADALLNLTMQFDRTPWQEVVRTIAVLPDPDRVLYEAGRHYYFRMGGVRSFDYFAYWQWVQDGQIGPAPVQAPPPPVVIAPTALANLARDAQNVHTTAVSAQTNASMEKLLAKVVPPSQGTERAMMREWTLLNKVGWNDILRVANDVNKWFTTASCRTENDSLYRRLLRGLVATINSTSDEMRTELYKRLWEECREATGMCCEGHITRLCNVMVGFDDAFLPPISLGELMQQKMAAIAGMDIPDEDKVRQATEWFTEHGVPDAERVAWLEAF